MSRNSPLVVAIALLLAGCGDDSTEPLVPTTLQLDREELTLEVQETAMVGAAILDQHGGVLGDGTGITWSGSNQFVAVVDAGQVTGVAPGVMTVTASAEGLSAEVQVTVEPRELTAQLGFDYDGADGFSGSFGISETFRLALDEEIEPHDWAVTFYFNDFQSQDVVSERVRDDGLLDMVWFWVDTPIDEAGSHALDGAFIYFGVQDSQTWEFAYEEMIEGTVEFTSVTNDRMTGTFSFQLEAETGETLSITNGTFDVPRVSEAELGIGSSSPAAMGGRLTQSPNRR